MLVFRCGRAWGNDSAERWIKANKYDDPKYGDHRRPTWGDYAQDSIPVFEQKTIEGHAVRATLLATGLTTAAIENRDPNYIQTAGTLWNNMVGTGCLLPGASAQSLTMKSSVQIFTCQMMLIWRLVQLLVRDFLVSA